MALIQSGTGTDLVTVGTTNKALRSEIYGPTGPLSKIAGSNNATTDAGLVTAGLNDSAYRLSRMDRSGAQAQALNNIVFSEPFEGVNISTPARLTQNIVTFVPAQSSAGGLNFNSTALTTAGAGALIVSNKQFPKMQRAPLHARFRGRVAQVTNATMDFGFGSPASSLVTPAVGAYFQVAASGVLQGTWTFGGTDTTTAPIVLPGGWQSNYYTWDIIIDDHSIQFMVQDTSTGLMLAEASIRLPLTSTRFWNASRLPVYARICNTTAPVSAANLILTAMDVSILDVVTNRPWATVQAMNGAGGCSVPTTFAQAGNWVNSTAPTLATLSNTVPGYTTLGGLFQFAAIAGSTTDYALFGYTAPAPYSFICMGVDIDSWNTGASVTTTPTLLTWGISNDMTGISLATAGIRRTTIGSQSFAIGAVAGANINRLSQSFADAPLVTYPGRTISIILRMPVASATASQVIQGMIAIRGYYE